MQQLLSLRTLAGVLFAVTAGVGCGQSGKQQAGGTGGSAGAVATGAGATGQAGQGPGASSGAGGAGAVGGAAANGGSATAGTASGGGSGGSGGGSVAVTSTYEAEQAFFTGATLVATDPSGFTGTGYVGGLAAVGDRVVFTVEVADAGDVDAVLAYSNPAAAAAKVTVLVNGAVQPDLDLPTSAAGFAKTPSSALPLRAGLNTVSYVVVGALGTPLGIDSLTLSKPGTFAARGATVPFTTYEAEDGMTNAAAVAAERTYGSVAAEASGRKAVKLEADGAFVEVKLSAPANAIVVRYSMPDAATGGGMDGAVGLYVNGQKRQVLALSSKYAWVYGGYPFDNDPSHGTPHRYFDDVRALVGDIPAGATVRLQKEAGDATPYYIIDLLDFELAPAPYSAPAGSLSIADYGAKSGDDGDDTQAISAAVTAARDQKKPLWIPEGDFSLTQKLDLDGVTIRGAGPWHSTLHGLNGKGGFNGVGGSIQLLDFALFGDVSYRDDGAFDAGMDGTLGPGSLIQNVWFEHTKVGVWTIGAQDSLIVGCRVHDTFADGINLTNGTRRTTAMHVHTRNTGDDAFAMWSTVKANEQSAIRFSTATLPMLANGVAAYGGKDLRIEDNVVVDTVTASAGIAVSTRSEFNPQPFSGTTTVARNTVIRSGGYEPNWKTAFGGLWIFASQSAIAGVKVSDIDIRDSTYQGLLLSGDHAVDGASFERVSISGATTFGIEATTSGSASFADVSVANATSGGASIAPNFSATKSAGNSGW